MIKRLEKEFSGVMYQNDDVNYIYVNHHPILDIHIKLTIPLERYFSRFVRVLRNSF